MGQGQKGSSDQKEGKKKWDESPASEDGHKCRVCRFPLLIALLQLLLGAAVTAVAFFMLVVSPSLLTRETPYWAGIILCLVSIPGFILYCVTYLPDERTSIQFIVKILYFALSAIGLVTSVVAMSFAGHHHSQTSGFTCQQVRMDCVCKLDQMDPIARTFTYQDVSDCEGVTGTLVLYCLLQIVLNLAQALVCALGAFVMWKHRYQVSESVDDNTKDEVKNDDDDDEEEQKVVNHSGRKQRLL
uniref:Sarcospan (Kras oncogene-associated gene) n=1 Tax=Gasterosteus aculeatus aculeatus TaxID=481459 RepID=G3PCY2_GASAC